MSEEATQEQTAPTPNDVAEATQAKSEEAPEETIKALRAALKSANAEAKENRLKATELDKIKQAQMSDLEKAQALAVENEKAAQSARAEALRWRVAAKHGISDEDAEMFLTGSDEESLTRQAERLAAFSDRASSPKTPKPDPAQGGSATPPALNGDGIEQALKQKLGIA